MLSHILKLYPNKAIILCSKDAVRVENVGQNHNH